MLEALESMTKGLRGISGTSSSASTGLPIIEQGGEIGSGKAAEYRQASDRAIDFLGGQQHSSRDGESTPPNRSLGPLMPTSPNKGLSYRATSPTGSTGQAEFASEVSSA